MKIVLFPWAKAMRNGERHPKNYIYWPELVSALQSAGHELVQVGIDGEEQLVDNFIKNSSIGELSNIVLECDTWIGVDSFGQHLAWSLGKRGIVIFGQSDPNIFGHSENINILKDRSYLREKQFWLWEQCTTRDECWVEPDVIISALNENFIQV
jgi:ADP-heptose:LPS heptosyltransferase